MKMLSSDFQRKLLSLSLFLYLQIVKWILFHNALGFNEHCARQTWKYCFQAARKPLQRILSETFNLHKYLTFHKNSFNSLQ